MLTLNDYLKNPCHTSSIPFWKLKTVVVPSNMLIVHNDNYFVEKYKNYSDEVYFRLIHNLKNISSFDITSIQLIDNSSEYIDEFVTLINNCYDDLSISRWQLIEYQKTPVYCKDLWVLIRNKKSQEIVGGGIGDFDSETGEIILEWIQVLPKYRKLGYGQFIVNTMLSKMKKVANFATVSGQINNPTQPEKLYRKCGFIGNDIWHILTKIDQ